MIKLLQSPGVASIIGMLLYLVTSAFIWPHGAPAHADAMEVTHGDVPSWNFNNPEVDMLIAELKEARESVAKRDAQLNDLAERLKAERMEINQVTQTVSQMQSQFDSNVVRVKAEETVNLKKLAKTYAAMSPEGAATILKQLDDTALVKMLMCMKETERAPILEAMAKQSQADAQRVAAVCEHLRIAMQETKP
jgi:flagellar motility protein MotE (MotC chaperone)